MKMAYGEVWHTLFEEGNPTKSPDPMIQRTFAVIMTMQRVPGHRVATQPPNSMPKTWIAPPGMSMYCVPRVSNPKVAMFILAKPRTSVFGGCYFTKGSF
jgi:hypothetical protein